MQVEFWIYDEHLDDDHCVAEYPAEEVVDIPRVGEVVRIPELDDVWHTVEHVSHVVAEQRVLVVMKAIESSRRQAVRRRQREMAEHEWSRWIFVGRYLGHDHYVRVCRWQDCQQKDHRAIPEHIVDEQERAGLLAAPQEPQAGPGSSHRGWAGSGRAARSEADPHREQEGGA